MGVERNMGTRVRLRATPTSYRPAAGDIRVEVGSYSFSTADARELAGLLIEAAEEAERLPARHDYHINLKASCALCVAEAGSQPDRLTYDDDEIEREGRAMSEGGLI